MVITLCNFFNRMPQRKQLSHSAPSPATVNAKNSDSMNDCAIRVLFLAVHEMTTPMMKTKPLVCLHSSDSGHQFASKKYSITTGYMV